MHHVHPGIFVVIASSLVIRFGKRIFANLVLTSTSEDSVHDIVSFIGRTAGCCVVDDELEGWEEGIDC